MDSGGEWQQTGKKEVRGALPVGVCSSQCPLYGAPGVVLLLRQKRISCQTSTEGPHHGTHAPSRTQGYLMPRTCVAPCFGAVSNRKLSGVEFIDPTHRRKKKRFDNETKMTALLGCFLTEETKKKHPSIARPSFG